MGVLCMLAIAGTLQATDCTLVAESYGGWRVVCNGRFMRLADYQCVYSDGSPKNMTADPFDQDFDTLSQEWDSFDEL